MSVDFFNGACQEPSLDNELFGICDDGGNTVAYTDTVNSAKWIATVKNPGRKVLIFTAIDNCIIKRDEYPGRGRCDAMLTSNEHLYFIELKDENSGWRSHAIDQLESTIQFFIESHNILAFKHKKAFACNKQHKPFQVIDNELNLRFFREYSVRIDAQAEIIIV